MTTFTTPPEAPSRPGFAAKAEAFVDWQLTFRSELVQFQGELSSLAAGTAVALQYSFSTTTTDAEPGDGYLRLDNATQNAATTIRIDNVDGAAIDQSTLLGTFDDSTSTVKGHIKLVKLSDPSKWIIFSVSSLASPSGYKNITVAVVASSAASPFSNADSLLLLFTRTGDKGDTGAGGSYDETAADLGTIVKTTAGTIAEKYCKLALYASGTYTLPDLSTITGDIKFGLVCPSNASSPPASVSTSDGWTISTGFSAGTEKSIFPTSIATAHGTWDSSTMYPPTLGTITGSAANTVCGSANLDTNYDVVLFHDATSWYTAAINNSTGACGAVATVAAYNSENYCAIYKDSTTSYVAFVQHGATACTVRAGSVNTGTLAITQGSAQTTAKEFVDTPVKLAANVYLMALNQTNDLQAATISATTTVTLGTAVASGAQNNGVGNLKIARSSDTEGFAAYLANGGGAGARQLSCRVLTVAAGVITPETASGAGTNVCANNGLRCLVPYQEGTAYIACAQDGTTATTGNYYGMTASGTTAGIGTLSAKTNNLPAQFSTQTYTHKRKRPIKAYNTTTMVFGHLAAGPFAATISGSTLTIGTSGGPASTCDFLTDATAGTSFYAVGASAFDKITISGTTISSSWQVAVSPTIIISDTLTDKAASYSGTWYKWTLPTMSCAITATKWLYATGNDLKYCGAIS